MYRHPVEVASAVLDPLDEEVLKDAVALNGPKLTSAEPEVLDVFI